MVIIHYSQFTKSIFFFFNFFVYLCSMKRWSVYSVMLLLLAVWGCGKERGVDPLRRSRVDGLNKEAFVNRYRDPQR